MKYEVVVYKDRTFAEGARLCIRHRLYVPNWRLLPTLQRLIRIQTKAPCLSVSFRSGAPVSLALNCDGELMSFTRKEFRRQGHGSACLEALRPHLPRIIVSNEGIDGSIEFWKKFGVKRIIERESS